MATPDAATLLNAHVRATMGMYWHSLEQLTPTLFFGSSKGIKDPFWTYGYRTDACAPSDDELDTVRSWSLRIVRRDEWLAAAMARSA